MKTNFRLAYVYLLASLLTLVACSDSNTLSPFQPEITNKTDAFQMQATGVNNVTFRKTYSWSNTGQRATVNHSTTLTRGSAHVTIRDSAGAVVYDKNLMPSLNEATATGSSGLWTIHVDLSGYSGTLNFRAEKL